jgi:Putative Ig domain
MSGGGIGYVARGYIDIGPLIAEGAASYSDEAGTLDMCSLGDCGTLLPKTMSITGLPSGLRFSPTTFHITGTAAAGAYGIKMTVTNSSGQKVSEDISLKVGS